MATAARGAPVWERTKETLGRGALDSFPVLTVVATAGLAVRLMQYVHGRSLRVDEAMLALNLMHRPLGSLIHSLDFNQAAPYGFLYAERGVIWLAGSSPYALRALPLLSASAAVVAFILLARRVLSGTGVFVATAWFATAGGLIFYAADVKQYSGDVLVAVLLYTMAAGFVTTGGARRPWIPAAVGGALVWLSHASVFVIVGIACGICVEAARSRRAPAPSVIAIVGVWLASAAVMAFTLPNRLRAVRGPSEGTQGGAYPGSRHSLTDSIDWVKHIGGQLASGLSLPTNMPGAVVTAAAAVVIVAGFVLLGRRRAAVATMLGVPLLAACFASWLHLYPLTERALLFALPSLILCAAAAVSSIDGPRGGWAAAAVTALVLAVPAAHAVNEMVHPFEQEEIVPALRYAAHRWQPGDALYVHYSAAYAFTYYGDCRCGGIEGWPKAWAFVDVRPEPGQFSPPLRATTTRLTVGTYAIDDWNRYLEQLGRMRGRRVWVVTTGARDPTEASFLAVTVPRYVRCIGTNVEVFQSVGARALSFVPRHRPHRVACEASSSPPAP